MNGKQNARSASPLEYCGRTFVTDDMYSSMYHARSDARTQQSTLSASTAELLVSFLNKLKSQTLAGVLVWMVDQDHLPGEVHNNSTRMSRECIHSWEPLLQLPAKAEMKLNSAGTFKPCRLYASRTASSVGNACAGYV